MTYVFLLSSPFHSRALFKVSTVSNLIIYLFTICCFFWSMLVVPGSIFSGGGNPLNVNNVQLHTVFHYHLPIDLGPVVQN